MADDELSLRLKRASFRLRLLLESGLPPELRDEVASTFREVERAMGTPLRDVATVDRLWKRTEDFLDAVALQPSSTPKR